VGCEQASYCLERERERWDLNSEPVLLFYCYFGYGFANAMDLDLDWIGLMRIYMHAYMTKLGTAFGLYICMIWGSVVHTVSKEGLNINTIYALHL
jgi:hypothetical protein